MMEVKNDLIGLFRAVGLVVTKLALESRSPDTPVFLESIALIASFKSPISSFLEIMFEWQWGKKFPYS